MTGAVAGGQGPPPLPRPAWVAGASKEAIGLKVLERVESLLSVIIEHVFGVYDGNLEVLPNSTNGGNNGLDVVGLNIWILKL